VVGVIVYNAVQERGVQRRLAEESRGRGNPMTEDTTPDAARVAARGERREGQRTTNDEKDLPDARLDYLIDLAIESPIPAKLLQEKIPAIQRRFANGVRVAVADAQGIWHRFSAIGMDCVRVRVGLQLVTRAGVANEAELIEFRSEIENLAAELHATTSATDLRGAMESAEALDRLCDDADIQIALHVNPVPGAAFDADRVAAEAVAAGLLAVGKRFESHDSDGQMLFAVEFAGYPAGAGDISASLTLLLDVPRVKDAHRIYESMVRVARQLGAALGGTLVDENSVMLDERGLVAIGAEIERIVADLGSRGITTGSLLARRLFA